MIDTTGFALPKPCHRRRVSRVLGESGRTVESPGEYSRTKRRMWLEQDRACPCGAPLATPGDGHRHHLPRPSALAPGGLSHGRGLGGGKRDDRFTVLLCITCHLVEEGHCMQRSHISTPEVA